MHTPRVFEVGTKLRKRQDCEDYLKENYMFDDLEIWKKIGIGIAVVGILGVMVLIGIDAADTIGLNQ